MKVATGGQQIERGVGCGGLNVEQAGRNLIILRPLAKGGMKKITVISGVGTRGYYRKFGYELKATYMVKKL